MAEASAPTTEPAEPVAAAPPPAAPPTAPTPEATAESAGSDPWVLRLGNYLLNKKDPDAKSSGPTPWAVQLGTYLEEKRPGPWSILANEKPHDPMVSAATDAARGRLPR